MSKVLEKNKVEVSIRRFMEVNEDSRMMTDLENSKDGIENKDFSSGESSIISNDELPKKLSFETKAIMVAAEVVGTSMLLFFGCMGTIDWFGSLGIQPPLNFGLTVMFIIQTFGHVSYAVLNPAVTVAAVVCKLIDAKMGFMFAIAQVIGASLGYGLLMVLTPEEFFNSAEGEPGLCMTSPHSSLLTVRVFFIEFFLTCALIVINCGVWDPRNRNKGDSAALKIGLSVAALSLAGGPGTGASMNPARSFAPALWNWEWDYHWIYWIAPLSAGLLVSIFYKAIFWPKKSK